MFLGILSSRAYAQYAPTITRSSGNEDGNPFFRLAMPEKAGKDSSVFVVHVYSNETRIISYVVSLHNAGGAGRQEIRSYQVADTPSIPFYPLISDSSVLFNYRIAVVGSDSIDKEFPVLTTAAFKQEAGDTATTPITVKKPALLSVHGNITVDALAADGKMVYQERPRNYARTTVNMQVEAAGLPFDVGYLYTTESANITNFRVSFNHARMVEALKKKMNQRIELDASRQLNMGVPFDIEQVKYDRALLSGRINSPDYQKELQKNKKLLEYGELDPSFKQSRRYKKARIETDSFDVQTKRLARLDSLINRYADMDFSTGLDANRVRLDSYGSDRGFKKATRRYQATNPLQSVFLNIRQFDIGMCSPDYNNLIMNGVSINGINVEVNPGNVYGAFAWGKTVHNFNDPFALMSAGGRTMMLGRAGIGSTDKLLLAVTVLKGEDQLDRIVSDSINAYVPLSNYVIGADLKYRGTYHEMGLEYAQASNKDRSETANGQENNLSAIFGSSYSKAWMGYVNVSIPETNTKIKMHTKVIDPYYYSFGTPFLRQDNFRIELKGEQGFLKRKLTAGVTYRRDEDNLYDLKKFSTRYHSFVYTLQARFKKLPFVMLLYSPNYQVYRDPRLARSFTGRVKLYQATVSHTSKWNNTMLTSTVNLMRQRSAISSDTLGRNTVDQFGLNESLTFMKQAFTISSAFSYSRCYTSDVRELYRLFYFNATLTKGIFKNTVNVSGGYTIQQDLGAGNREVVTCSAMMQLPFGIRCQLTAEKHFIHNDSGRSRMNLGRITIIKPF